VIVPVAGLLRQRTWHHARTLLLGSLVRAFTPAGRLAVGIDDAIERRRSRRVRAARIHCDALRP
jgi:hypothetical protein